MNLATNDVSKTPELEDIVISTDSAPNAVDDAATTTQDTPYTFPASGPGALVFNDLDPDTGDELRVVAITMPAHGTAALNEDGSVTYNPSAGFTGTDTFSYTVSDGLFGSSADVTMSVGLANRPPVAVDDAFVVSQGAVLAVPAGAGVLANDSDPDGGSMTAIMVTWPAHGTLTCNADGSFTYTPSAGWSGADSFTYRASDTLNSLSNIATASINVTPVNRAPSFVRGANQTVLEDAGARSVTGWATAISAGAASESGQALNFIVSNNNNALFSAQPAVDANGTPDLHARRERQRGRHGDGATARQRRHGQRRRRHQRGADLHHHGDGRERRAQLREGRQSDRLSDAGAQTVSGWATALQRRPGRRSRPDAQLHRQQQQQRAVLGAAGRRRERHADLHAAANANGFATVTVQAHDNGGTANGGVDTSAAQTFTITCRRQPCAELHQGRQPDRARGCRRADRHGLGDGDQRRRRQRSRPGAELHRQQQQQRAVLRPAGDRARTAR